MYFSRDAYVSLWYLCKKFAIGMILDKKWLHDCFADWTMFPEQATLFTRWLLKFKNSWEWIELFGDTTHGTYVLVAFKIREEWRIDDDGIRCVHHPG